MNNRKYKQRYIEYVDRYGSTQLLPLSSEEDFQKLESLKQELREGKISGLATKWGVGIQYVQYIDIDGWTIHKEIEPGDPSGILESLAGKVQKGFIKKFVVKFGESVPRNHFGGNCNADWYGPGQAISGDF